jgi:hypothetical protein
MEAAVLELLYIARFDFLARDPCRRETDAVRHAEHSRGANFVVDLERASAARRKARKSHLSAEGRSRLGSP